VSPASRGSAVQSINLASLVRVPRAFGVFVGHWQDIPADMSPQKPHSVAGSAGLFRW
jgi:hypothetical protein